MTVVVVAHFPVGIVKAWTNPRAALPASLALAPVQGPRGPTGPQGPQGDTGMPGPAAPPSAVQSHFGTWVASTYNVPTGSDAHTQLIATVAALGQDEIARIKPGTYVVSAPVPQASKNPTWETDFGAHIDVTSAENWFVDRAAPTDYLGVSIARRVLIGGTTAPGLEHLEYSSWNVGVTGSTANYEKDRGRAAAITHDPSTGPANNNSGPNVDKDLVTWRFDAVIAWDNPHGRAWATNCTATIEPGGDGHINCCEDDLYNGGSAVSDPTAGVPLTKYGRQINVLAGTGTAALRIGKDLDGEGWFNALWMIPDDLVDDPVSRFLSLKGFFEVDRGGAVTIGGPAGGMQGEGTLNAKDSYWIDGHKIASRDPSGQLVAGAPICGLAAAIAPVAGVLTIDLSTTATVWAVLSSDVTSVVFANWPLSGRDQRVCVYIVQPATPHSLTGWPPALYWPGGIAPTITPTASAVDCLVFDSFDAGGHIFGNVAGQNYKQP